MIDPGRIAGAPISWGVSEVPDWGYQMPAERVLSEMHALELTATEVGPDGFLPDNPAARSGLLAEHGLRPVGGFLPVVLHAHGRDPVAELGASLDVHVAMGERMIVLAADTGRDDYDERVELDGDDWRRLLANCEAVVAAAAERGLLVSMHPHVGSVIERPEEVRRLLAGSMVPLCLDTGHLLIGGSDPCELAREAAGRVAHVHLKDVDAEKAARVRAGTDSYSNMVADGLYRPLGQGDVDIAGIVSGLENAGYSGWYVLEQDTMLPAEPPPGGGPVDEVRASLAYLRELEVGDG